MLARDLFISGLTLRVASIMLTLSLHQLLLGTGQIGVGGGGGEDVLDKHLQHQRGHRGVRGVEAMQERSPANNSQISQKSEQFNQAKNWRCPIN